MKEIKLTQDAYVQGGSVRVGVCELTEWYEAAAVGEDGSDYRVIWEIADPDAEDESMACDWDCPWAILDDSYTDVSGDVEVVSGV